MIRVLFVCSQNRLRSPRAEQVFSQWPDVECASAGVQASADVPLSGELIDWADLIVVMERVHQRKMAARFRRHMHDKRVVCLGIPDDYAFMDPDLIALLEAKMPAHLRLGRR